MHNHSLEAYNQIITTGAKDTRSAKILDILSSFGRPMSDYEVLQVFKPGSDDLNLVRPRLTELHQKQILIEGPRTKSSDGRRNVRTNKIKGFEKQLSLF